MTPHNVVGRRGGTTLIAFAISAAVVLAWGTPASAAVVATVPLATAANYSVLGGSTVTNTGNSTLAASLGLWPGTAITGFPPGQVLAPGTTDTTNAAAHQAQSDLTAAYVNAAGRPITATTTADLGNLTLQAGVYSGPSKGALSLTGPLTLDGAGNANSVFIFQTDSTLITASSSTVTLINGAQACNVFWQIGSSATLGTGSVFSGNILALTDITVTNSVTVHGRALARNGEVTLDNDTFTKPNCQQNTASPTTTSTTLPETVTTQAISPTTVVAAAQLPRTGSSAGPLAMIAFALLVGGLTIAGVTRRRRGTT
jgi:LPXTG-motif cell wall-anchored protein